MKKKTVHFLKRAIRRTTVNRKYKDHLFRMIFHTKKDLLDLYNAVNHSSYTDPEGLIITTLEDVIFLGMKNDLSFIIESQLNLYEHQSTWNENMPLRGVFYFSDVLRGYVEENHLNIYKEKRIQLPTPRYIVFYNGKEDHPDRTELRLSDAYAETEKENVFLECKVTVLNINKGHNQELMEKCRQLSDYAYFVQEVRDYIASGYEIEDAVVQAVDECIRKDILSDILSRNRAEVIDLFMTTYDAKLHKKAIEEEAREAGMEKGLAEGMEKGLAEGIEKGIEKGIEQERIHGCQILAESYHELGYGREIAVNKLAEKYNLSAEAAEEMVAQVWS